MRMRWHWAFLPLLAAALVGCRARTIAPAGDEDLTTHLGETVAISLADWLALPRTELAQLADEWANTAKSLQTAARENKASVALLPWLHPPITIPVFHEAKYSAVAGFSVPPYWKEGQRDPEFILHLARFGDREAALKLADPLDEQLRGKIEAVQTEKNYPVEWTRLVGLVLSAAQFKLANGEKDGAAELIVLHRQLRALLDAKAATGMLGAVLLGQGRRALQEAEAAWRSPAHKKTALADDVKAALAAWGDVPSPPAILPFGAEKMAVVKILHGKADGHAITPRTVQEAQRALDLLALPLPRENMETVVAFSNERQALGELMVVYRAKTNLRFPEPTNLAHQLIDHAFTVEAAKTDPGIGIQHATYTGRDVVYEVNLLGRSSGFGAIVRLFNPKTPTAAQILPRDFGGVHLNVTFDQNRLAVAPEQQKAPLTLQKNSALAKIKQPVSELPSEAVLHKEADHDLLKDLTLRWPADLNPQALTKLALPLWAAHGYARLEGKTGPTGEFLSLIWEDARTRLTLRLPYNDREPPEFVAEDRRGTAGLAERATAATALDTALRRARIIKGKAQTRLARSLAIEDYPLETVTLGMDRAKALAVLPRRQTVRQTEIPDGISLYFLTNAPPTATHWARQAFLRFGPDRRLAEIRVRFEDDLRAESKETPALSTRLKSKPNGAPEVLPAPWAALWTDLPGQLPAPTLVRWMDDLTLLSCQKDAGGAEVVLTDRPIDSPQGVALPPLTFLSRGVDQCQLGQTKADLAKAWRIQKPMTSDDGTVAIRAPSQSPYDAFFVYFDNDRVTRILARHRAKPADLKLALQQAWGRDFDRLGMLRRQDGVAGSLKMGYGWHDDQTRVRTFAQEVEDGVRLFTEWAEWPITRQDVALKE